MVGILTTLGFGCSAKENEEHKYARLRENMVATQIADRGVADSAVLAAMRVVERHRFVPYSYRSEAYEDRPLPIGETQTISQPYIVALMTEVLGPDSTKKVLEIGTGSGYQAAILAQIVDSVYTIEIIEKLGVRARALLKDLGYTNIAVRIGDGYQGWPEAAPFDAIIVTCAPSHVPEPLKEQLAEGGRMVIPVGKGMHSQFLVLLSKRQGEIVRDTIICGLPVNFKSFLSKENSMLCSGRGESFKGPT